MFSIEITNTALSDFLTLFYGILIEAFPFVVFGVFVSIFIHFFLNDSFVIKIGNTNKILSHVLIALTGFLFPVCECGNVPVVRSFITKRLSVSHAITFLLAAPILNPITLLTTYLAFDQSIFFVLTRALGAFVIAVSFGLLLSLKDDLEKLFLTKEFYDEVCLNDHHHHTNKFLEATGIFRREFFEVFIMLIFGASVAAATQVFIPRDIILSIGTNEVLSVIAMMILAFVISICANVDAFFAIAFRNTFSVGSLLSFLVFGPMIDIKMLLMLKSTFKTSLLLFMSLYVALASLLLGLIVNIWF